MKHMGWALPAMLLAVSGASAAPSDPLAVAAESYRPLMVKEIERSLDGARELRQRIAAKDLAGAEKSWISARIGWERSEVFTAGFYSELDSEIDTWPNATLGFHAIEAKLFGAHEIDVAPETDALIFHLSDLSIKIRDTRLTPEGLLEGTARLAYEVGESKADGGESRFSGTSLDDMRNNVEGIDVAYHTIFAPALGGRDAKLAGRVEGQIGHLRSLLAAADLKSLDTQALRAGSEDLVVSLQDTATTLGLRRPTLEDLSQR
jgi:iron uptake system EfeUOB component EfeO/EfeM